LFLPGEINDIYAFLEEADIFLFTSRSEGFGIAVIEAMFCGLPCVAYKLPSLLEIDSGKKLIYFVEQGDFAGATEQIVALASNIETTEDLVAKSRTLVSEKYSVNAVKRQWIEYFNDIMNAHNY
jgi:glycosyltransferase involved in cell wall biosynthesis